MTQATGRSVCAITDRITPSMNCSSLRAGVMSA
jgi:hypothetical protein